jgi:catalase
MRVPMFQDRPTLRPPPGMPSGRVLAIMSPTEADVASIKALARRLRLLGVELDAASECHGEVRGEHGEPLLPNLLLVDAPGRDWDAMVVAGGRGAADVAEDQFVRTLVADAAAHGKPVAALGAGRRVLERAGVDGFASDEVPEVVHYLVAGRSAACT